MLNQLHFQSNPTWINNPISHDFFENKCVLKQSQILMHVWNECYPL